MPNGAFDLGGRAALITGGKGGMGMAKAIAEAGADIAIWGTNPAKNAVAREELKRSERRVLALECDVGAEDAVEAAFAETLRVLGRIDGCFANAGISSGKRAPFVEFTAEDWHRVRHMVERRGGGSLVGTASLAAIEGAARNEHYAATKGGLVSMIQGCSTL